MECEIVLGVVSPIWHDFAMQELSERFFKWVHEAHPELFNKKECSDQTTNQRTTFPKAKKYKKISIRK